MIVSVDDERLGRSDSWLTPRRVVWAFVGAVAVIAVLLAIRLTETFGAKRTVTNKGAIPSVTVAGRLAGES